MSPLSYRVYGLLAILIAALIACSAENRETKVSNDDNTSHPVLRESITFILGDDASDNTFYQEAARYYTVNNDDRTEYVVGICRSLKEVRNYLCAHPPTNNLPWGQINLVTHGNQWLGLSVRVLPGKYRSTVGNMEMVMRQGLFSPLPDNVIDSFSEINVHGCGVGHNKLLLDAIGKVFCSNTHKPLVRASLFFENYSSANYAGNISESNRYFTKAFFAYYKKGYRLGDIKLSRQLSQRYPDADIYWRDVLKRTKPRWPGDSFHYTFNVPVKWIVIYENKESIPDISSDEKKQQWLQEQDDLMSVIESTEIPMEKFSWNIKPIKYELDNGQLTPAIRAKGYTTILCILCPIVSEQESLISEKPFVPELNDTNYYYVKKGEAIISEL